MKTYLLPMEDFPDDELREICGDSIFVSGEFARLWSSKGGRPVVWCLQDGATLAAIMPGVEFGQWFYKRFMSMPDGCYGGVFCAPKYHKQKPALVSKIIDAVLAERYLRTFIFDFTGEMGTDPRFEVMALETTLVDISQPDWLPPDKKLQAQIRKAEREGIVVQQMDWLQHGESFMDLVRTTEKRHHQKPIYSQTFFRELHKISTQNSRLHWVWCEHQGHGVCSHIYLIENGVLQGWQIYFDKKFSFLKPNQFIRFTTCRDMAERGIRWLNLGGTPENAPGLSYYKNRWGGETYKYRGLVNRQGLGRII